MKKIEIKRVAYFVVGSIVTGVVTEVLGGRNHKDKIRFVDENEVGEALGYGYLELDYYLKNDSLVDSQTREQLFDIDHYAGYLLYEPWIKACSGNTVHIKNDKMGLILDVNIVNSEFVGE